MVTRQEPYELVPLRPRAVRAPLIWFRLGAADRALVQESQGVGPGQPLYERVREPSTMEVRLDRGTPGASPGAPIERGKPLAGERRRSLPPDLVGRVLFEAPGRRLHVATGRHPEVVLSPISGAVEAVLPGAIGVRADGYGLPGVVAAGESVSGPLLLVVDGPDTELRASSVSVAGAGAILVAGARLEIEALTRARATGVRGLIAGGLGGKDLRALAAANARQRAALHPGAPFGLVSLEGYGRRAIPRAIWDCLAAVQGREVALVTDPPMVVVDRVSQPPPAPWEVRVAAGEHLGREGSLVSALGPVRQPSGLYQPAARVALEGVPGHPAQEIDVPLADLERFQ